MIFGAILPSILSRSSHLVICLFLETLQRLKQILTETSNDVSVVCLHHVYK